MATKDQRVVASSSDEEAEPGQRVESATDAPVAAKEGKKRGGEKKTARGKRVRKATKKSAKRAKKTNLNAASESNAAKYPRHTLEQALRIPRAILDQNAGRPSTTTEAASYVGVGPSGEFSVEVSSGLKYGLLERPEAGKIQPTERARSILRPQTSEAELQGIRDAVLAAPGISEVYAHYRGENLPDDTFLRNALVDTFGIPSEKVDEFKSIFVASLERAQLLSRHGEKLRVLDITGDDRSGEDKSPRIKQLGKTVTVAATDTCFVMQPFAAPLGDYYDKIYKPAIEKVGLRPIRADADIFGTGKIMDQVWRGITSAKVLVAELTSRNPNVFYELGLAHALRKPVVLVSSNELDVPFDLHHIRVIYYEVTDPFWGSKLIEKVAENILSALKNPEEAVFKSQDEAS